MHVLSKLDAFNCLIGIKFEKKYNSILALGLRFIVGMNRFNYNFNSIINSKK
jgi:hypothetical protein